MKRSWLPGVLLLALSLAGCLEAPAPTPVTRQTVAALTPEPTATPLPTLTPPPTSTPQPTRTPQVAPTVTATAVTQAPPDVSYCARPFGPANAARFSARLAAVRVGRTDEFDQVRFEFADASGPLHGAARCFFAEGWPAEADIGARTAPGAAVIALDLEAWAHDELFESSPLTQTITLTDTNLVYHVGFAANSLDSRGATLGVGLPEPRPFRVRIEDTTLIVEVAHQQSFPPSDDPLGQAAGQFDALAQPVFFLQNGDVYRLADGHAEPVVETPELEIGLAVSPDGATLAVCRAPADAEPFALPYAVRATLWTMRADGSEAQLLADVGGCAEPAFAASGRTIAFTANVAPSSPVVLQVWTVPVVGGMAEPVAELDEWNRSQPQWLADGRLLYRAANERGQSILLLRDADGEEREVTARMLSGATYRGIGDYVVNPESGLIAVEALRAGSDGADLVLLRDDGAQVASEQRGFWQRPLGFDSDDLLYLTADCPSQTVLSYTIYRRAARGTIAPLLSGSSAAGIGTALIVDESLLYVRANDVDARLRGPRLDPTLDASSSLWRMSLDGANRAELLSVDQGITALATNE